ncbi:MAG: site-specific integrase [Acidimicrobiaceae bacterium]|nr:site-specific integrase [Acidimicrobiaceae bacterium]
MIKARTLKRKGSNGKPIVVYDIRLRDPNGHVYTRTLPTKKAAVKFEATEKADRHRGTWIDPRNASLPVEELAEAWLASNPAKRSGTRARDKGIVDRHIVPVLGGRPIGSVTPPDVQALVNAWSLEAAPRTVNRQYGVLRAVFRYAVAAEYLARTPCREVKLPEPEPLRRRLPDEEQLAALAAELGPYGLMVWTAVITGLRWGEVAGLRVGSVDVMRSELKVIEQRTRDLEGDRVTAQPKSKAGVRTLSIPTGLAGMFSEHLAARGLTGADAGELVFVAERGGPLNYSHWRQRIWLPACNRAGLEGLGFHDLRRVNATAMVAGGVDLKTAQTRAGHSDIRLTIGLYAQAVTSADRAAAEGLGARFLPSDASRRRRG